MGATMKWTVVALNGRQPLIVDGRQVGFLDRREDDPRPDGLRLAFDAGVEVQLHAAVDVSERLQVPRVFIVEGTPSDRFLLLGGERAYLLTTSGTTVNEWVLFRKLTEAEYWATQVMEEDRELLFIYEAGVLRVGRDLQIRWHQPKLLNDEFKSAANGKLIFVRDDESQWSISSEDGRVVAS